MARALQRYKLAGMDKNILHFPAAVKHEPAIDAWLQAQRDDLRPFVQTWFTALRRCGEDIRELMHDGWPTACVETAAFAHVAAYQNHVSVYFFFGALLDDPAHLLEGAGKRGRHAKLKPGKALDARALATLIETAYLDICARLDKY